jgi:hypothetical protein
MGFPPSGEVVGKTPVMRVCGHQQEFQEHRGDRYRMQRLAKFQQTRCPPCAAKLVEQQKKPRQPSKGEALKQLPPGTQVILSRAADGSWGGTVSADGTTVEMAGAGGEAGPGPQAVTAALALLWIAARAKNNWGG